MSTWSGSVKKLKYSRLKTLLKTLVLSVISTMCVLREIKGLGGAVLDQAEKRKS